MACFENQLLSDQALAVHITAMASDIRRAFPGNDIAQVQQCWVKWAPQLQNSVVVNVDVIVQGVPCRGGFGGCIRSFLGEWVARFFGFLDNPEILHLELLGIFHGLTLTWDRGFRIVE